MTALRPELYKLYIERKVWGAARAQVSCDQHARAEENSALIVRASLHCLVTQPSAHNAWWRLGSAFAQLMHWTGEAFDASAERSLGLSPAAVAAAVGGLLRLMRERYEATPINGSSIGDGNGDSSSSNSNNDGGGGEKGTAKYVVFEPPPKLHSARPVTSPSTSNGSSNTATTGGIVGASACLFYHDRLHNQEGATHSRDFRRQIGPIIATGDDEDEKQEDNDEGGKEDGRSARRKRKEKKVPASVRRELLQLARRFRLCAAATAARAARRYAAKQTAARRQSRASRAPSNAITSAIPLAASTPPAAAAAAASA